MKMRIVDGLSFAGMAVLLATPAQAGCIVPAPAAGVGLGALALLGVGYRALRKRIDR